MKKIAIILKGRRNFGDLICYLPLILKLKLQYQGCKVTIFGRFPQCGLLCFDGAADQFIDYSKLSHVNLIKMIRSNFDFMVNFNQSSFKIKLATAFLKKSKSYKEICLDDIHNTYMAYKVLSAINSQPHDAKIISKLSSNKSNDEQYLSLLPGGGGTAGKGVFKRWDIRNFISVADNITKSSSGFSKIIFILGSNEKSYIDFIPDEINGIKVKIAFNLTIPDLIDIASNSRLAISNDCGPSHIFHMLEKSMISLFGIVDANSSPYDVIKSWFLSRENAYPIIPSYNEDSINTISSERCAKLALSLI